MKLITSGQKKEKERRVNRYHRKMHLCETEAIKDIDNRKTTIFRVFSFLYFLFCFSFFISSFRATEFCSAIYLDVNRSSLSKHCFHLIVSKDGWQLHMLNNSTLRKGLKAWKQKWKWSFQGNYKRLKTRIHQYVGKKISCIYAELYKNDLCFSTQFFRLPISLYLFCSKYKHEI